jgi:hypothetical protein
MALQANSTIIATFGARGFALFAVELVVYILGVCAHVQTSNRICWSKCLRIIIADPNLVNKRDPRILPVRPVVHEAVERVYPVCVGSDVGVLVRGRVYKVVERRRPNARGVEEDVDCAVKERGAKHKAKVRPLEERSLHAGHQPLVGGSDIQSQGAARGKPEVYRTTVVRDFILLFADRRRVGFPAREELCRKICHGCISGERPCPDCNRHLRAGLELVQLYEVALAIKP